VAGSPLPLKLTVNHDDGSYAVSLDGKKWVSGSEHRVGSLSNSGGDLVLVGTDQSEGKDEFGKYSATTLNWAAKADQSEILMHASFREYADDAGMIVFEQLFPKEIDLTSNSGSGLAAGTIFPSFSRGQTYSDSQWTCQAGQGGASAQQEFKDTSDNTEEACGALCASTAGCLGFDFTEKSKDDSCRLFDSTKSRLGDGGKDNRQYCRMSGVEAPLDCFAYHGTFPSMKSCTLETYSESTMGGSPLVLYNSSDSRLPMTVFSPLNQPMAHHMAHSDSFIGAGVKATVEKIPAGWSQLFVLSASAGINDGMMAWGDRMLTYTGRPRVDNRYLDDSHGGIGFWTDNGGYYHYSIGNNKSLGSTYEEVLPKVKAYHDELGVPFKHWQFDSWFYPKDGGVNPGGGGGAVTNWTALDSVFPSGMVNIQNLIGLPTIMHNRQWSIISDYIHNWTDIEWYKSQKAAVPKDPVKFFDRFFTQQEGWGLSMYEQDWMVTEYQEVDELHTNISMGDLWLYGMAEGAAKSGRTVQYCMPTPYEVLSAASLPSVTNARATGDYFHSNNQWAVGNTALFYWALNILPFKDGFYSSTNKQVGGQTEGPETNPDREALMATLSAAMVGPMDGIYLLNKTRVMTTCRADGAVLKPDRPLTAVDACFRDANPTCQVYHTYSDLEGLGRVGYYFNNNGKAQMTSEEVYVPKKAIQDFAVYNWYSGELAQLQESNDLSAGYEGHIYATVMPIVNGWVFVGEPDKYVTSSTLRFSNVESKDGALSVVVHGVAGETVNVCAAAASSLQLQCQTASFSDDSTQSLTWGAEETLV
jgi:hypothetical protein